MVSSWFITVLQVVPFTHSIKPSNKYNCQDFFCFSYGSKIPTLLLNYNQSLISELDELLPMSVKVP